MSSASWPRAWSWSTPRGASSTPTPRPSASGATTTPGRCPRPGRASRAGSRSATPPASRSRPSAGRLALALAGERFDDVEYRFAGPDGAERWARCAGGPLRLEDGQDGAWVSFRDVGREETILRELREERDLVTALVDLSPLAVAVARAPDLILELANDVAKGLRPELAMVGMPVAAVFPEAGPAGFLDLLLAGRRDRPDGVGRGRVP